MTRAKIVKGTFCSKLHPLTPPEILIKNIMEHPVL